MRRPLLLAALALSLTGQNAPAQVFRAGTNFWVEAPDDACAARVLHDAENARQAFAQRWLGRAMPHWVAPVPIVIQPASRDHNGHTISHGAFVTVIVLTGKGAHEVEEFLGHEIGHAIISREVDRDAPRWLHEGVCVADEIARGAYPWRFKDRMGRVPLATFLTWSEIPFLFAGDDYYGQAASFVSHVTTRWGPRKLWRFHKVGRTFGYGVASIVVYGRSIHKLEAEWLAWTRSMDCAYPKTLRGTAP